MPYKNKPRPYEKEYQQQLSRDEHEKRATRERARYEFDNPGKDGKVVGRKGKDIDHVKPLSKGGTNTPKNLMLKTPHDNRSFYRDSDHTVKKNVPRKKK